MGASVYVCQLGLPADTPAVVHPSRCTYLPLTYPARDSLNCV